MGTGGLVVQPEHANRRVRGALLDGCSADGGGTLGCATIPRPP